VGYVFVREPLLRRLQVAFEELFNHGGQLEEDLLVIHKFSLPTSR
jgi:hypothetical protein